MHTANPLQKVYAVGETVLDIIFSQNEVKAARAGGSMLNSAVSLGHCGIPVSLISETGQDQTAQLILAFLEKKGVDTAYLQQHPGMKTALAMAFLNEQGDATYDFYKHYPDQRLTGSLPVFDESSLLLFGSWFGIDPALRPRLPEIVKAAHKAGSLIFYDPNFRKPHLDQLKQVKPYILENMEAAHIIRASHEDLELIFGIHTLEEFGQIPQASNKPLILTRAAEGAEFMFGNIRISLPALPVTVVSTIGAGDNFNAGVIYGLTQQGASPATLGTLTPQNWQKIIQYGLAFAAATVQSYDNWVPEGFRP